jgi:hypothetical protein
MGMAGTARQGRGEGRCDVVTGRGMAFVAVVLPT